jgi:4-hydroxy-4-methyl-2-oxoglutarate aldolase
MSGAPSISELIARYQKIAVAAVSDVLDDCGLRNQHLPHEIKPIDLRQKVAGPAFTIAGKSTGDEDPGIGPGIIDYVPADSVLVWDTSGENVASLWGDLMSAAAKVKGAQGVVIDGGIRDLDQLLELGMPIFARFRTAAGTPGRWKITEFDIDVKVGGVRIHPGDFIFGDNDGIVVIPAELRVDVLTAAEKITEIETVIRQEVMAGERIADVYKKYKGPGSDWPKLTITPSAR